MTGPTDAILPRECSAFGDIEPLGELLDSDFSDVGREVHAREK